MISQGILIVDDEDFIRDLLSDFLSLEGYHCRAAASAEEALGLLSPTQNPFDLILVDRHLEHSRAEDFISTIMGRKLSTPIILLTGDHEVGSEEARRMGARGVVHKPFQLDRLLTYIQEILECP